MKKNRIKNKEIRIPLLSWQWKVIVVWGTDKFVKKVATSWNYPKNFEPGRFGTARGFTYSTSDCHPIIHLQKAPRTPTDIGTLAHEACHAVKWIFENIGEEYSSHIFESLVGYIVSNTLEDRK